MKDTLFNKITVPYRETMLEKLKEFVGIDSVYDEKTVSEKDPFGKGVSEALYYIENLARNDGFEVTNYDNKVVEIIYGKGEKNLTIMAHADVVPAGSGWGDKNPFSVVEEDGVLFGRGVADDKGPLLACYYAMVALRDNKMLKDYQIRFLVGGNEESGSLCMEHYFHTLKKKMPTLGFSPDSSFPLIFAEKGIGNFEVKANFKSDDIISIHGGVAFNAVIDYCEVVIKSNADFIKQLEDHSVKFEYQSTNETMTIGFIGKAAHGSVPECGINAGMIALSELKDFYKIKELEKIVECYTDVKGRGVNAYSYSEDMEENSLNVGVMNYQDGHFEMTVNFRYVNTADMKVLYKNIVETSKPLEVIGGEFSNILYYPKDSLLVSTLLHSYQEETGDYETGPLSTGGGTYAKEADNVVAFGMEFQGWDSKMHSPGESLKVEHLNKGMAIYARAIYELGEKLS